MTFSFHIKVIHIIIMASFVNSILTINFKLISFFNEFIGVGDGFIL